jgi:hypothetical protein
MDKPAASSVLQAMAEAYPDRVDPGLLAIVLGCERSDVDAALCELIREGLAEGDIAEDSVQPHAPRITEGGMVVASGQAQRGETAAEAVQRLEAHTLQRLASAREACIKRESAAGLSVSWPGLRGRPA